MSSNMAVPVPRWTFAVRVAQLVLAVLVLICVIVPAAIFVVYYGYPFGIFVSICTIIITGYWIVSNRNRPALYNKWAILGLDIFMIIFWLSSWSILASLAAALGYVDGIVNAYDGNTGLYNSGNWTAAHALTGLGAFLGAVEFVLFIVTLVFHSIGISKTRTRYGQNNGQGYASNGQTMVQDKEIPYTATELPERRAHQQV